MRAIKGWEVMTVAFVAKANMYFRLRGTNLPADTPNQTDSAGDPLVDTLTYTTVANPDPASAAAVADRDHQHARSSLGGPVVLQQPDLRPRHLVAGPP